jgi:hypothetical protein
LLEILLFFTEYKFQKISGSNAATSWQELAADLFLIGWKGFPAMNTQAYFATLSMTKKEKSFILMLPG